MLPSITNQPEVTMSSLDFLNNYINPAREAAGQSRVRPNDFNTKLCDELEISKNELFVIENTKQKYTDLNYDQMLLIGMRESKAVRKSVLVKLKELQQPQQDPALILARKVIELADENERLEKTKAQINDRRTATLMNKASQDAKKIKKLESQLQEIGTHLSVIAAKLPQRVDTEFKSNVQTWRVLKQISDDMNCDIIKVDDMRYGQVNTYHIDVIERFKEDYM